MVNRRRNVLLAIMLMRCSSSSSLGFRALVVSRQRRSIIRQSCLLMSTSVTENSDESLDDIMDQVEDLLSDLSKSNQTPTTSDDGWLTIDWNKIPSDASKCTHPPNAFNVASKKDLIPSSKLPSPVEKIFVKDRIVYLKRDDLLRLPGSGVSGNKARKLYSLNQIPARDFPACVVSYGGPQSNAMVALAAIVHSKHCETGSLDQSTIDQDETSDSDQSPPHTDATDDQQTSEHSNKKRFVYYTKTLPRFLRNQPSGNLFRAQTLGMDLVELPHSEYSNLFGSETGGRPEAPVDLLPPVPGDSLWVPQGGACGVAVLGGRMLAQEIASFWSEEGRGRPLTVCVPGGTCSTALLLHREIQRLQTNNGLDIRVVVVPCVGDDGYARRQMMALNLETGASGKESEIPTVLLPSPDTNSYFGQQGKKRGGYFHFGEPDAAILKTARTMEDDCDVHLDLLYGAPSWTVMLRHWRTTLSHDAATSFDERNPLAGREVMYVHSGGLEGVASQLTRYRYKGLVELDDIQYPTKK